MIELPMWQESIRNGVQGKVKEDYQDTTYVPLPISRHCPQFLEGPKCLRFRKLHSHFLSQEKLRETPKSHEQMGRRAKLGTLLKSHSDT